MIEHLKISIVDNKETVKESYILPICWLPGDAGLGGWRGKKEREREPRVSPRARDGRKCDSMLENKTPLALL